MSNTGNTGNTEPSRITGMMSQTTGKIKETVGGMFGYEQTRNEGIKQQRDGEREVEAARAADQAQGFAKEKEGMAKQNEASKVDSSLHREGRMDETKGKMQQSRGTNM
eukprot:Unigene1497_Nuclearia_a/m.4676 Unigene1497_Nuclearia_a/g.4676  ORF Unigene1497_Nuclearia_a/g.4676 Unigene1497_Nuclearia_a/m.4676 type:complete len:108 (-) Unigene1497_Nuclearia_a:104-427(-)